MSYLPGIEVLYTMATSKAGDTLQASATEAAFASQFTIPANKLQVGQVLRVAGYGTFVTSAAGPSQQPKVRIGPAATALTSRALAADGGALALLLGATDVLYRYEAEITVRTTGTTGKLWCAAGLTFVSMASGQATGFLAGPNPGKGGLVDINTTVDNVVALTDTFGNGTTGNTNTLQSMLATLAGPVPASN